MTNGLLLKDRWFYIGRNSLCDLFEDIMKRPSGNLWIDTFFARKTTDMIPDQDLSGKVIVFTGGTDGIGRVALERLASMGADIVLVARNPEKTAQVVSELTAKGYAGTLSTVTCDLGMLNMVRQAAAEILQKCKRIDLLINCAGGNIPERALSSEGYELNFVVNYLSPFLLTELLLERVKATPNARIINLTSATQQKGNLDLDDLHREKNWSIFSTYAQAKLCIIMHAQDVAKRLQGSDVTINCLNPGYIQTNIGRGIKGVERFFLKFFGGLAAPAWVGGERIVAASLSAQYAAVSGKFIYEDTIMAPNPQVQDQEKAQELLNLSFAMTGLTRPAA
jgi:NAD(P)-dependent dehydrogenase (short-subunit alcohol dehydrogenase family)